MLANGRPKLIRYHSNVPWAITKLMSIFVTPTNLSINIETLVKIGRACSEIFGAICQFFAISSQTLLILPS